MPVRLRITLLFTLMVFLILGIVCASVYFFSYRSRLQTIKTRLTNRALTTARLLSRSEVFDRQTVERIDSLTTISLKDKSVQAFNYLNKSIYTYSDLPGDTLIVDKSILDDARINSNIYFTENRKEAVAYYYKDEDTRIVVVCSAEDADGLRNLSHLKNILMFSFIGGVVITIVGGLIFSKELLQPIRKISEEVAEISAQNLTNRIHTGKVKDEWYQLSATLNELLNRLQDSFETQRRFISNASHELLTPLTSISSQLEVALQRERSNEHYQKVLVSVLNDVRHLNKLTRTLLEFAKASGNKGGININLLRADELVMQMPSLVKRQHPDYEVVLKLEQFPEDENELLFFGNDELITTALTNVVINACKYSSDSKAKVELLIHKTHFQINISDNGVGIAAEDIAYIFEPFYRAETSQTLQAGFGLGLPLAYRIVRLHKGNIEVHSMPGKGTIFTITIPSATNT